MTTYERLKKEKEKQGLRLSDFYKQEPSDKIWWINSIDEVGVFLFSFDKKVIYNFFSDQEELTDEQKKILFKENPELAPSQYKKKDSLVNKYN